MPTNPDLTEHFRSLHVPGVPLLIPNPWDVGSATILESLGFRALATTSGGFAGTLGRVDGSVSREQALAHAAQIAEAVAIPVSADLESCFAQDPAGVAETVRLAAGTGVAGCSIEDYDRAEGRMYAASPATERVAAAAEAAHSGPRRLVLTARADNGFHGIDDLDDTIARLRAFEAAGADVLYAPMVSRLDDLRRIRDAVSLPINVLARPHAPTVTGLAGVGVARISVGSGFFLAAMGELVNAARELLDEGTYEFLQTAGIGRAAAAGAFG
ncbi:MAG: isocitrate lyase/phosphoenolpyruvate mutase family protein [Micrococcales bacterium]|nr:isocitrate lyase/phosphoenolpyruvate mutase family protein [Micrococcales bacterium]